MSTQNIVKNNRSIRLAVLYSLTGIMLFLGVIILLFINGLHLSSNVKEEFSLSIWINEGVAQSEITNMYDEVKQMAYVESIKYISKEQAARDMNEEFGQDFIQYLGHNPLPNVIDIRIKKDHVKPFNVQQIEKSIKKYPIVSEVIYDKFFLEDIFNLFSVMGGISLIALIVLMFICLVFINSSIKMSLYSNRFKIKTMQIVGASESFIRKPFLIQAFNQGWWAGIISCSCIAALVIYIRNSFPEYMNAELAFSHIYLYLILVISGIAFSLLFTSVALNKYLYTSIQNLYD